MRGSLLSYVFIGSCAPKARPPGRREGPALAAVFYWARRGRARLISEDEANIFAWYNAMVMRAARRREENPPIEGFLFAHCLRIRRPKLKGADIGNRHHEGRIAEPWSGRPRWWKPASPPGGEYASGSCLLCVCLGKPCGSLPALRSDRVVMIDGVRERHRVGRPTARLEIMRGSGHMPSRDPVQHPAQSSLYYSPSDEQKARLNALADSTSARLHADFPLGCLNTKRHS